jgi:hypothetical protein
MKKAQAATSGTPVVYATPEPRIAASIEPAINSVLFVLPILANSN